MIHRLERLAIAWLVLAGLQIPRVSEPPESTSKVVSESSVAPATRRMAARLEELAAAANPGVNPTVGADQRVAYFRKQLDATSDLTKRVEITARLADELLRAGRTEEALADLAALSRALIVARARLSEPTAYGLGMLTATAFMRLGEQSNCLARHGPDSCLMPIRGLGIHTAREGSSRAIDELSAVLARRPDDLGARWLLNLAHMTLGSYPSGVPDELLIPPATFESAYVELPRFPNEAAAAGVAVDGLSGGVVMDDLDRDGRLDLVVSSWGMRDPLRYFHNEGGGRFRDLTAAAGLTGEVGGLNLLHADYDNDGFLDILVLRGAWLGEEGRLPNSLLRNNGDGTFIDVTEASGLLSFHPTQTGAFVDYDNDGHLDVFIGNESSEGSHHPCELYRNQGDGTFAEIAASVGLDHVGFVKGVAWGDIDNDGWSDLYLSRMGQDNILFRNEESAGKGRRFRDVTVEAGVAAPIDSFPVWFFDYDNDGNLDLFVAPFPGFEGDSLAQIAAGYLGKESTIERPRLYHNQGGGRFRDVAREAGLASGMLAMGANFGDLDNDGLLDLYLGTGEPNLRTLVPNRAYRNAGRGRFDDVTFAAGVGHLQKGHGIAFGDLDNDGDQDVYAVMGGAYVGDRAFNALFVNPGVSEHHWLELELEGGQSNRSAIGSRVRLEVREGAAVRQLHRVVGTGGSFGSSSLRVEIGLGRASTIESVQVRWPSGLVETLSGLEPERGYRIREGSGQAVPLRLPPG